MLDCLEQLSIGNKWTFVKKSVVSISLFYKILKFSLSSTPQYLFEICGPEDFLEV